jgi:hypothetical protein
MRKSIAMRLGAVGTAVTLAGGLAVIASGTTGAYFSETKGGSITGSIGSIHVSTLGSVGGGANHIDLAFSNLMPGEAQTVTFNYQNTGPVAQDVYLTFPNVPALHALNNLGKYGEVHVVDGGGTHFFDSANLNDNRPDASGTCGAFNPAGCWPLPAQLKVASNVGPTASGSVSFTFSYPALMTGGQDGVFNHYPSPGAIGTDVGAPGNGLPVNVVATQVGQQP